MKRAAIIEIDACPLQTLSVIDRFLFPLRNMPFAVSCDVIERIALLLAKIPIGLGTETEQEDAYHPHSSNHPVIPYEVRCLEYTTEEIDATDGAEPEQTGNEARVVERLLFHIEKDKVHEDLQEVEQHAAEHEETYAGKADGKDVDAEGKEPVAAH